MIAIAEFWPFSKKKPSAENLPGVPAGANKMGRRILGKGIKTEKDAGGVGGALHKVASRNKLLAAAGDMNN